MKKKLKKNTPRGKKLSPAKPAKKRSVTTAAARKKARTPKTKKVVQRTKKNKSSRAIKKAKKTEAKQTRAQQALQRLQEKTSEQKNRGVVKKPNLFTLFSNTLARMGAWLKKYFATLLMIFWFGLNTALSFGVYLAYTELVLSFRVSPTTSAQEEFRGPQILNISIPSAEIKLPITPAYIVDGVWQTSDTTASHLASSARPGEGSNIVVYGHNRSELMDNLHELQLGQEITLQAENGKSYHYQVENIVVVTPDEVAAVLPTDSETLTVYTCTGLFSEKRLVVRAKPTGVSSQWTAQTQSTASPSAQLLNR